MEDKYNYKTIYLRVKEDILKGAYPTGTLLPTELTLADKYSVSRPTISKVYNRLQKEGYVNKKKGLGTIVLFKEGIKEGEAKGVKKEKIDIAHNLKKMGLSIEMIIQATGLSTKEIESL